MQHTDPFWSSAPPGTSAVRSSTNYSSSANRCAPWSARPPTQAHFESRGVQIARGDMLDLASLVAAMDGADAVITTAAGYTRGGKSATDIDTVGNANLAEAAHRAGVRRFVLTSILTSDQTPGVPHFWHKKLAEDKLQAARRAVHRPATGRLPGPDSRPMGGDPITKGRIMWIGKPTSPLTFVLISDLARYLAAAVDVDADDAASASTSAGIGPSQHCPAALG